MIILFLFILALAKSVFLSFYGLNFLDYGESLHNGVRIIENNLLYRDIWSIFPPGDVYFPAIIMKIFGQGLLNIRFIESFIFALFIVVITLFVKKFLRRNCLLVCIFAVIFAGLHTYQWFVFLFFYLPLLFLLEYFKLFRTIWLFLAGLTLGVGFLFRHDMATATFLTIFLGMLVIPTVFKLKVIRGKLLSAFLFFSLGICLIIVPIILWLINNGTFNNFLYLAFIRAPQISKVLSIGFDFRDILALPLNEAKYYTLYTLFFYLVYISIYPLVFLKLYSEYKKRVRNMAKFIPVVVLLIFGIIISPYAFSVTDLGHLIKAGFPALILGVFLIQESLKKKERKRIYKIAVCLPLYIFILGNTLVLIRWLIFYDYRISFKQGSIYVNSKYVRGTTHPTALTLGRSLKFIESNSKAGDYIFVAPYHSMLYFLSGRKDPSEYNNFAAGYIPQNEQAQVIKNIETRQVKVVIYDPVNAPQGKLFRDYYVQIHNYLSDNFIVVEDTPEGWLFMKRE